MLQCMQDKNTLPENYTCVYVGASSWNYDDMIYRF